ncbi:toll/interleukin-1 receptor domain-containing protein [Sphingomonas faeni]|uniref:toll/interleukin-1 receptor domain-containing protein n=1 Tax=Sphingomonas faeni TaxID=185950 RepID=UPI0027850BE9|nr:toll/interleukin-1 receptor domain-containing protein [Sphingomonas faeni]MDQ0836960.1 hypothetical protein [Sphingomonas faeni]
MTLRQSDLRSAATRQTTQIARSASEATRTGQQTAFLCHSHADRELVIGTVETLRSSGWNVYVDWADASMPAIPDATTASRIKERIVATNWFLFLATTNSMSSRWCPWEIGYADGRKPIDRILVIPTTDGQFTYGSEYLGLYRRIDRSTDGLLAAYSPSNAGVYLRNL